MNDGSNDTRFKPGHRAIPKAGARFSLGRFGGARPLGEESASEIVQAMIDKAKAGDGVTGRLILERVWPSRKGARIAFDMPAVKSAADLPGAIAAINRQTADGDISPDEASVIVGLLDAQRKAIETNELADRLAALEARMSGK